MTVPDFPSVRNDRALYVLAKRCEDASTMGMFRIGDSKFLLAYSEFAIHVGRHGEPIEGPFIEWESKPETIAYCAPYVCASRVVAAFALGSVGSMLTLRTPHSRHLSQHYRDPQRLQRSPRAWCLAARAKQPAHSLARFCSRK